MSRGVIYYNRGTSFAVRLLVSLASLRQYYRGPVTILSDGDEAHALSARIAAAFDTDCISWTPDIPSGKNTTYLAKTKYLEVSPCETTLCLDIFTLVVGTVDELFVHAENSLFVVAHFAGWRTDGGVIGKRIRAWTPYLPDHVSPALRCGPAV